MLLTVISAGPTLGGVIGHSGTPGAPRLSALPSPPLLGDNGLLQRTVAGVPVTLTDAIWYNAPSLTQRSFTVHTSTAVGLPTVPVQVETNPLLQWSLPQQLPGGADALPPLADWHWTIKTAAGVDDTRNWTIPRWTQDLARVSTWEDHTWTFTGTVRAVVPMSVGIPFTRWTAAPGVSLVLNPGSGFQGPLFPSGDSDYSTLVSSLRPQLLRFGEVDAGTSAYWNPTTQQPVFSFTALDRAFTLAAAVHSGVLYSLSAGSWGDGNLLPTGMPVNHAMLITKGATSGYLPTAAAYRTYVQVIVDHIATMHQKVAYWSVGNELPLTNLSVVNAYISIFNVASSVIHAKFPGAAVGTDVMMDRTYLSDFAKKAKGVGFLSFHFYPAIGLCVLRGAYCPPQGGTSGTVDPRLWQPVADIAHVGFYAPHLAQEMWFNITHRWIPVLDSESNLNGIGGGAASGANGTDPRQQTLLGASWAAATLIRGASENLSTFTWYALTGPATVPTTLSGPYGGWGFGLTSEGMSDQDTKYAPYWALEMWAQNVPAGAPGVALSSPDPLTARAYAVKTPTGLNVVVVNLVATQTTIPISVGSTAYGAQSITTLDQRSYWMPYNGKTHSMSLVRSGVVTTTLAGSHSSATVVLDGYGVAILRFKHLGP